MSYEPYPSAASRSQAVNRKPTSPLAFRRSQSSTMNNTPISRAKACTECRQVKLKCDSAEKFPASCSRCMAKGLDCRMDANFKRIPTRNKLEEVTSELTHLKEAMRTQSQSAVNPSHLSTDNRSRQQSQSSASPGGVGGSEGSYADSGRLHSFSSKSGPSVFYQIENSDIAAYSIGQQQIGDVHFDGPLIVDLFKHFYQHYYIRNELVLDTSLSLPELRKASPLLFWAIIFTSSRYHPQCSPIFPSMIPPFEQLLASYLVRPMHSTHTIHAILIVVSWPLPSKRQPEDPTWNFAGSITNAAEHMGMNYPGNQKEYGFPRASPRDIELRSRTWLMLFHRNITLATRIGLPPPLADEASLRNIVEISSSILITDNFKAQLDMLCTLARYTTALRAATDPNTRDSLILMACGEVETVHATTHHKWTPETELQYLSNKLFLYGFAFHPRPVFQGEFIRPNGKSTTPDLPVSKKLIFYAALSTATAYIHAFSMFHPGHVQTQPTDLPPQIHWPKQYFFELYHSTLTLYAFLSLLPNAPASDQDQARNAIRTAHSMLSANSLGDPRSQWARTAQSIELVGHFYNKGYTLPREKDIHSRGGAGLFYDAMMKVGVIKSERGGRSYGEDLTRGPPDDAHGGTDVHGERHGGVRTSAEESSPPVPQEGVSHLAGAEGDMYPILPGLGEGAGMGNGAGQMFFEQPYMSQEWDAAMWGGWDQAMFNEADVQMEWDGIGTW